MNLILLLVKLMIIPLHSWLDRQRGTSRDTEKITKAMALAAICLCQLILLGVHDWSAVTVGIVVWTGYVIGWGQPLGHMIAGRPHSDYEKWQFLPVLRAKPVVALAFRGALVLPLAVCLNAVLWAVNFVYPVAALMIDAVVIAKLTIAYAIAFPAAPWLVMKYRKARGDQAWAEQEYVRGFMIAAMLFAASPL